MGSLSSCWIPLCQRSGRLFPYLTVDKVVKRYAYLRRLHPELHGTVFHSTRKWFITQCERTGVPEHFTATLVGHHSARSANKLTYGLYSAGISDAQKREIVEGVRAPEGRGPTQLKCLEVPAPCLPVRCGAGRLHYFFN